MEKARVTVILLLCIFQMGCGTEVNVRTKPGDNITLYCDCAIPFGSHIAWFRNCSHESQPTLLIKIENMFEGIMPRFSFVLNNSSNSYDLHIENVSVSDEGIYYCAKREKKITSPQGIISTKFEYEYGNKTIHLSVSEAVSTHESAITSSLPAVPACVSCWSLLFSVCPVCVLVSSLLSSIFVYCFCRPQTTGSDLSLAIRTANFFRADSLEEHQCEASRTGQICVHTEVSYRLMTSEHL